MGRTLEIEKCVNCPFAFMKDCTIGTFVGARDVRLATNSGDYPNTPPDWCKLREGLTLTVEEDKAVIFGSMVEFNLRVAVSEVNKVCQAIWDDPGKYGRHGDEYYDFLKFLWVKYPDGTEKKLADIVNAQ